MSATDRSAGAPSAQHPVCDPLQGRCGVCGDEGLVVQVASVDATLNVARGVAPDGAALEFALDLVDQVHEGDTLIVHQGFAIARVEGQ